MSYQTISVDKDNKSPEYWKGVIDGNQQAEDWHKESNKGMWKPVLALALLGAAFVGGVGFVTGTFFGPHN